MAQQKLKKKAGAKKQSIPEPVFQLTKGHWAAGILLAFFAFMLYVNTFNHGYVLDDYSAITINRFVQEGFAGIPKLLTVDFWHFSNMQLGYYRPLSLITFAMEYQFFGAAPHVSHFFNVLFYALSVFFVFLLLSRLFSSLNPLFPFLMALLFAAHPIHTEIVNNIKGRDELLSFLNTVAMLYFALRYTDKKKPWLLILSLFLFYLGLLSKESAMTGLILLPLVLYYSGKKSWTEMALKTLPYLAVIFLFFVQRRMALGAVEAIIPNDIINYPYRENGVKFSSAFMLFFFSLKMLIWPYPLRYDYSYNQIPAVGWENIWALLGICLFFCLLVFGWTQLRKKTNLGMAIGFFLITMIPMMAFILFRGGIFAERNLFTPSLGFCMAVLLIPLISKKVDPKPESLFSFREILKHPVLPLAVLLISIGYAYLTVQRNPVWVDSLTLFTNDRKTGENSAQNQLHYGSDLVMKAVKEKDLKVKDQMVNEGMSGIRRALTIYPGFGDALFRYGYAYEVKLTYKLESRYIDSTIYYFNKAIEQAPTLSDAYRHLGIIYEWLGKFDVASFYYNKAFEINPLSMEAKQKADELRATKGLDVKENPLLKSPNQPMQIIYK